MVSIVEVDKTGFLQRPPGFGIASSRPPHRNTRQALYWQIVVEQAPAQFALDPC